MISYVWVAVDHDGKLMSTARGPLTSKVQALDYANVTEHNETERQSNTYRNTNLGPGLWYLMVVSY